MKWKQHYYTSTFWNYLLLNIAIWWGCISKRGRSRSKAALKINLCLISLRWYNVEKLTGLGSSNLNLSFSGTQQKVKKMIGKCVTFCFITVYAKVSPKSSREGWVFYIEVRSLYWKLIFTHFVSCWNRSHEIMKKVKHEIITRNWTYELLQELPSDERIRILGNEELRSLFN